MAPGDPLACGGGGHRRGARACRRAVRAREPGLAALRLARRARPADVAGRAAADGPLLDDRRGVAGRDRRRHGFGRRRGVSRGRRVQERRGHRCRARQRAEAAARGGRHVHRGHDSRRGVRATARSDHRRIVRTAHRDRRAGGAFVGPARGPRGVWRRGMRACRSVVAGSRCCAAATSTTTADLAWRSGSGRNLGSNGTSLFKTARPALRFRPCLSNRGPDRHSLAMAWRAEADLPSRAGRPPVSPILMRQNVISPDPLSRPPVEDTSTTGCPATLGHSPLAVRHSSS